MSTRPRRQRRLYLLGCFAFLAVAVLLAVVWIGGRVLTRARGRPLSGPVVTIRKPLSGARLSLEHGEVVVIEAAGPADISRYELWVDGARRSVLHPPADPGLSSSGQIRWIPEEEGVHVLVALAFDARGLQGRSAPVVVEAAAREPDALVGVRLDVQAGDTPITLSERTGLAPELLSDLTPGDLLGEEVVVPVPRDRLPPGYFGEGGPEPAAEVPEAPPAMWAPPAGMPLPAADLTASNPGGCQVDLAWQLGGPASGVRLYRFGGLADDFYPIADLAPRETGFVDAVPWGGSFLYIVSTTNGRGETPGPMTRVEVPAQECPDQAALPETGAAWLQFEGQRLVVDDVFDHVYCYLSLDGNRYERIPEGEDTWLTLLGDGWDLSPYLAGINRRVFEHDVGRPVSIRLECWGWRGNDLTPLGNLDDLRPREDWRAGLTGMGAAFRLLFGLGAYQNDLPPLTRHLIDEEGVPPPPANVHFAETPFECLAHVNRAGGSDSYPGEGLLNQWGCLELDTMLIWNWPSDPEWTLEDIDGYKVEVIEDYANWDPDRFGSGEIQSVGESGSANLAFPINHMPSCLQEFGFRVYAFRETDDRGRLYSDPSAVLHVSPPDCPDEAVVEFELTSIEVDNLDDGCILFCGGESLQAYGSGQFFIHSGPGTVYGPEIIFWSEECGAGVGGGCLVQPRTVHNGTIELAQEDLRRCTPNCTSFGPGNNTVRLILGAGDSVEFRFALWDVDDVEDDVWCGTIEDIGLRDRIRHSTGLEDFETVSWMVGGSREGYDQRDWAQADYDTLFYNMGHPELYDQDSGCTVRLHVRGLGLYRGGRLYGGHYQ